MTSRELHDRVGGFREAKGKVFWLEDQAYVEDIAKLGYEAAFLEDLRVHHTGGAYYAPLTADKAQYWKNVEQHTLRKIAVKRALLRLPMVARLNDRFSWFTPPESSNDFGFGRAERQQQS